MSLLLSSWGHIDFQESAFNALIREIKEETGFEAAIEKFLALLNMHGIFQVMRFAVIRTKLILFLSSILQSLNSEMFCRRKKNTLLSNGYQLTRYTESIFVPYHLNPLYLNGWKVLTIIYFGAQ
ncbi:hypothetical protein P618_200909 [Holospora obtusa F1]|uniref:Nudix hydrolase domain-containing protein n=1 Tax=Holospora obtusa F1 TaxID=1399147 RepID=W6TDS7_HOLOB|nr:NUDIX hydrolase [Holospora obtusa]ETZ06936.1 hypothetical protein P618_200909 [Holospora obtusa F1]